MDVPSSRAGLGRVGREQCRAAAGGKSSLALWGIGVDQIKRVGIDDQRCGMSQQCGQRVQRGLRLPEARTADRCSPAPPFFNRSCAGRIMSSG